MPTPRLAMSRITSKQPLHLRGGQRGRRLVHHENARGVGQGLGDRDDLPPADRQFADRLIDVDIEADLLQSRPRRAAHRAAIEHARPRQFPAEEQIGGHVEARDEIEFLKDRRDARGLCSAWIGEADGDPVDLDLALIRRDHAGENIHQGRLAGAVLAKQRVDFPALEIEIDAAQCLRAAKALDDATHGEQWGLRARVFISASRRIRAR